MANPFLNIPDWLSWDNQGAGIAVSDLSNNGQQALIVLMVDSAAGKNKGLYRVGKNLDVKGTSSGGWGDWIEIHDWFSDEKQGGGIAATTLGGKHKMFILNVDSPVQQNAGLYQLLDLDPDPAREGTWDVLSFYSGVLAVHAALLHTGKVSSSPAQGAVRCGSLQQPRLWQ